MLELEGSDRFLLLATEDLDAVVDKAIAARLESAGQACNAAKRIIALDEFHDEFADRFIRAFTAQQPADPTESGTKLGSLFSTAAARRLESQIQHAFDHGATLHSWGFAQLGQFIAYKARRAGVPVVCVDPAYTSRTCAECGHIDKANRVSQAWFACRSCGFVDHADRWGHLPCP